MTGDNRIVSIDFWRGVALLTIFINHVPGNVLEGYTYRNFGFSDAAELFVLLAGVSAAFAYLKPFEPGMRLRVTAKIGLRAFQLYTAHIALFVIAFAVVGGFAMSSGDSRVLGMFHFDVMSTLPVESLIGLTWLTYQPAYLNILPMYVVLMLLAPVLIALVRANILLGLGCSAALYVATQLLDLALPIWPNDGRWFFNPLAWQFLFTCGLAIGKVLGGGGAVVGNRVLDVVAGAVVVGGIVLTWHGHPAPLDLSPLPAFLWEFDKTNLALPRLLHVLAVAYCVSRLPLERWLRSASVATPLIVMGRHALPVFCVGTVLSFAAQVSRPMFNGALFADLVILSCGILVHAVLAWALEWHRSGIRAAAKAGTSPV